MAFDLGGALRSLKPQRRSAGLERRPDSALSWAGDQSPVGGVLLLDTSVYLDVLQGRTPEAVDNLLTYRLCHHSAVCLAELSHVFGRLDPAHPTTKSVPGAVADTIEDIPAHRLHAPDANAWGRAGMLAGLLFRLNHLPKGEGHERRFLNDALIFHQAGMLGATVLTGNVGDFDYLSQLVPSVRVIFYRAAPGLRPQA
ncbi:type II toxin-antitoxin system VapC family toxin [Mesorhizobium sp. B2-4-9]|uniref:type II toxin-antitoxin system VapC family toxin n=1 Tax=Mesorhizobium sp. B2-4-9 TaxID=2589940 RepID=UPI00112ED83F|nr:type II toxin-antitoxin system VapC family toxin [Mesorhizobium sp. B2-4-9]TPL14830.1 type II toxin-antitoxin system VapC family toxin [Mesorhizobium sp. B2-4-9]